MMRTLVATLFLAFLPALTLADGPVSHPSTRHALQVYTAFGGTYPFGSISGAFQRYTFTGRESSGHSAAGAPMFYRNRPYSPSTGLMLNRNPWGYIHNRASLYDAMEQNPVMFTELFSEPVSPEIPIPWANEPRYAGEEWWAYRTRIENKYWMNTLAGRNRHAREMAESEARVRRWVELTTNERLGRPIVGTESDHASQQSCGNWVSMSKQDWLAKRAQIHLQSYSSDDPTVRSLTLAYSQLTEGCEYVGVQVRTTQTNILTSLRKALPTQFQEGEHGYNPLGFVSSRYATQEVWNVGDRWDVLDVYCCSQSAEPTRKKFRESILGKSDRQTSRPGRDVFTTTPVMINQVMDNPELGRSVLTEESAAYLGAGGYQPPARPFSSLLPSSVGNVEQQDPAAILRQRGRIVIGEDMGRVRRAASVLGAETFEGEGMAGNRSWIRDKMAQEYEVFDIGPYFTRRLERRGTARPPPSPFYGMERFETEFYPVARMWTRTGRWQGESLFMGEVQSLRLLRTGPRR